MKTIGPNPTAHRVTVPRVQLMRVGESRLDYVKRAARACRRKLRELEASEDYRWSHQSFAVRDSMLAIEAAYTDLGTFGVEHISEGSNQRSPAVDYLNTGDSYELTVLYVSGQFRVGSWGDIVERGNYA